MYWNNFVMYLLTGVFLFLLSFTITKKIRKKKISLLLIPALIITFFASCAPAVFPVERLFLTFESPDALGEYAYSDASVLIVEGKNTVLIHKIGTEEWISAIRTEQGYRFQRFGVSVTATGHGDTFGEFYRDLYSFSIFSIGDEHYIRLSGKWGSAISELDGTLARFSIPITADISVLDNLGSEFHFFELTFDGEKRSFSALAYLDGFDDNYSIVIEERDGDGRVVLTTMAQGQ